MSVLRSSILSETAVIILSYRLMVKFISLMLIFHSLQDKKYKNFPGEKPPLLGGRFAAGKGRGRKGKGRAVVTGPAPAGPAAAGPMFRRIHKFSTTVFDLSVKPRTKQSS